MESETITATFFLSTDPVGEKQTKHRKWYIKYLSMPKYQSRLAQKGIIEVARPKATTAEVDFNFLDQAFAAYKRHKVASQTSPRRHGRPVNDIRKSSSKITTTSSNSETETTETTTNNSSESSDNSEEKSSIRRMSKSGKSQQLRFGDLAVEVKDIEESSKKNNEPSEK